MENENEKLRSGLPAMEELNGQLDNRMKYIIEILEEAPIADLQNFLDIGMGNGLLLKWLSGRGKKCTGIGKSFASYGIINDELKQKYGIESIECDAEKMPFADKTFDCIIMSHVLEHCRNIGLVLEETKRVLSDDGWLFVFVPPHENTICAGHLNAGWNIGQLMYVLLINGFDIKNGKFIQYGYNVCAFVQKNKITLPELTGDKGDIYLLQKNGFFPLPIKTKDLSDDNYYGNIKAINWDLSSKIIKRIQSADNTWSKKIFHFTMQFLAKIIPDRWRLKTGNLLFKCSQEIKGENGDNANNKIDPKILKG